MFTNLRRTVLPIICITLIVSLLNWICFATFTDMFKYPLELSSRNGGRYIASYTSPDGSHRADVYLYDETSMSLAGIRVRIETTSNASDGWNVAYMYGSHLYKYGELYHELRWLDNNTIMLNEVVLDVFHMTYID